MRTIQCRNSEVCEMMRKGNKKRSRAASIAMVWIMLLAGFPLMVQIAQAGGEPDTWNLAIVGSDSASWGWGACNIIFYQATNDRDPNKDYYLVWAQTTRKNYYWNHVEYHMQFSNPIYTSAPDILDFEPVEYKSGGVKQVTVGLGPFSASFDVERPGDWSYDLYESDKYGLARFSTNCQMNEWSFDGADGKWNKLNAAAALATGEQATGSSKVRKKTYNPYYDIQTIMISTEEWKDPSMHIVMECKCHDWWKGWYGEYGCSFRIELPDIDPRN